MLADPYRLEGEGDVPWTAPSVHNPASVKRVSAELDRSLHPTRPAFLKWICDKLSALPTQTSTGINAALWTDNVIDVCSDYPEDLLQSGCLELLRTKTFRPSPAEIVAVIEPKFAERKRMLDRARSMLAPITKAEQPFVQEPREVRLRTMRDSFRKHGQPLKAAQYERELAAVENREPEEWAREPADRQPTLSAPAHEALAAFDPEAAMKVSRTARRCAELAAAHRTGQPAPEHRDVPE